MPVPPRILFVDDEDAIRLTLPAILRKQGFEVATASNVSEALSLITAERFDVLISDLNIGEPGDGFTVVSAMRRVQPQSVTLILTGYPAFESALRAIREQVDDFLTKPAPVEELVSSIKNKLEKPVSRLAVLTRRVPQIIMEHKSEIIQKWYEQVERIPEIKVVSLSREERLNNLDSVVDEVARGRERDAPGINNPALDSSASHGVLRREQGYSIPMLLEEARVLHCVISDQIRQHMLEIEISYLISDMIEIEDRLHRLAEESVRGYLRADTKPQPA